MKIPSKYSVNTHTISVGFLHYPLKGDNITRKIVGSYIDTRMTKELVIKALQQHPKSRHHAILTQLVGSCLFLCLL